MPTSAELGKVSPFLFPALTSLRLLILWSTEETALIKRFEAPKLQDCTFSFLSPRYDGTLTLDNIFQALVEHKRPNLARLTINGDHPFKNVTNGAFRYNITLLSLQFLSECTGLISFSAYPRVRQESLSNADLATAFSWWPELEVFRLGHNVLDRANYPFTPLGAFKAA